MIPDRERCYAECHYAECRFAVCRNAILGLYSQNDLQTSYEYNLGRDTLYETNIVFL